jgi:diadenylate cyclase
MGRERQLDDLFRPLLELRSFRPETIIGVIDIVLVSYLIYRILLLIRGARAWRIVMGIVFFVLMLFVSKWLHLFAVDWMLEKALILGPVALVILLLPELRQAIEGFGRLGYWSQRLAGFENAAEIRTIDEVVEAASELAKNRIGALVVIERGASLADIAENGIKVDAVVTGHLLQAIFHVGNPLHDGAVVIRGDRIVAAACRLPFSENPRLAQNLHMRHRAAVGMAEQRDCSVIVVSEERGTISYVADGLLKRVSADDLRDALHRDLRVGDGRRKSDWTRRLSLSRTKEENAVPPVS